jgi:phosphatidylserine decarboxylase
MYNTINKKSPLIAREVWKFILFFISLSLLSLFLKTSIPSILFFLLAVAIAGFFRDPRRITPQEKGAIIAPADGKIILMEQDKDNKISLAIFLSPLDVHINRSPISGKIKKIKYSKGNFIAAYKEDSSEINEKNTIEIETDSGDNLSVTQIAGFIARRIVCWKKEGDYIEKGERFGLIQFGSRTDLIIPTGYQPCVSLGDRVRGGETIVAKSISISS